MALVERHVGEQVAGEAARPRAAVTPIRQPQLIAAVAMADTAILFVTIFVAQMLLVPWTSQWLALAMALAVSAAVLAAFQRLYVYTVPALLDPVKQTGRVLAGLGAVFAILFALVFLFETQDHTPRRWLAAWAFGATALMLGGRLALLPLLLRWSRSGRLARRTVIVGGGRPAETLIRQLREGSEAIRICGVFDDRARDRSENPVERYRILGSFDETVEFCRREAIDLIIVTLPASAEDRILGLLRKLWVLPIDIRISAAGSKLRFRPRAYTYIGNVPFLAVFDRPLSDWDWVVKAAEDRIIAALAVVMLAPVMLGVAIAVKLTSKGPILFKQKRYGFNNQLVEVYKFRSMYTDMSDATAAKLVTKDDPRVTPVGRFIRKTSLDELPQLFNVLRGELSLVGPRPHATQAKAGNQLYDAVVEGYYARHRMKPGITGLAQIHGWRGETDTEEKILRRVEYDVQYIDNWSLWLDLYILAMTPVSLLNTRNAY